VRGTWRGAPLLVTPKDKLSKALEMDVCFHNGPTLGHMEGRIFIGPLREGINFFIWGNFYMEFERHAKKRPCNRAALSIGPCWTWRGLFTGTFERKENAYLGSSSVGPEDIKS